MLTSVNQQEVEGISGKDVGIGDTSDECSPIGVYYKVAAIVCRKAEVSRLLGESAN